MYVLNVHVIHVEIFIKDDICNFQNNLLVYVLN